LDSFSQALARAHLAVAAGFPHLQYEMPTLSDLAPASPTTNDQKFFDQSNQNHFSSTLDARPSSQKHISETPIQEGKYPCTLCDRTFARYYKAN
jgi:hypothetical protein